MIAGETHWTPRRLLALIERFPEASEYHAELIGDRAERDWTLSNTLAAAQIDSINVNTLISGNWKKGKEPKFEPTRKPPEKPKKKTSLMDIMSHFAVT